MTNHHDHFRVLDGWRGASILLVLAAHLLPLGPNIWQLNSTTGPMGMALFFTLSGFLITNFLLHRPSVSDFLIRRFARIIPLAWLCLLIALIWRNASPSMWLANFFFYSNWPPMQLPEVLSPFWSLCIEMQFYVGIAILFLFFREKGLLLLMIVCAGVTLYRMLNGVYVAINTYYRVDEILVGCILALAYNGRLGSCARQFLEKINPYLLTLLFIISCHPRGGFVNYFRPYFVALLVGWTLVKPEARFSNFLHSQTLGYIAAISYSLYLIHPLLAHSWLGSGETIEKYLKRPLLFAVLFAMAHASTFYYEKRFINMAKRLTRY